MVIHLLGVNFSVKLIGLKKAHLFPNAPYFVCVFFFPDFSASIYSRFIVGHRLSAFDFCVSGVKRRFVGGGNCDVLFT